MEPTFKRMRKTCLDALFIYCYKSKSEEGLFSIFSEKQQFSCSPIHLYKGSLQVRWSHTPHGDRCLSNVFICISWQTVLILAHQIRLKNVYISRESLLSRGRLLHLALKLDRWLVLRRWEQVVSGTIPDTSVCSFRRRLPSSCGQQCVGSPFTTPVYW